MDNKLQEQKTHNQLLTCCESRGLNFVSSSDPKVLMRVPGCWDVLVQDGQHSVTRFTSYSFNTVTTLGEFNDQLNLAAPEQAKSENPRCFCAKLGAVIALTFNECIYEVLHTLLRAEGGPAWASGLTFLNRQQEGHRRTYEIFGVHARLCSEASPEYLEARLMRLGGLQIAVTGNGDTPPKRLHVSLLEGKDKTVWAEEFDIPKNKEYCAFDNLLRGAMNEIHQECAPADLRRKLFLHADQLSPYPNDPIHRLLSELFENAEEKKSGEKKKSDKHSGLVELGKRIQDLRERLFDSLIVAIVVRARLEKQLNDLVFLKQLRDLNRDQLCELKRWNKPPEKLEEEDASRYVMAFDARLRKSAQLERESFQEKLPQLLKKYKGQYVALCGGEVVGFGPNEFDLAEKISQEGRSEPVMVKFVNPNLEGALAHPQGGVR